MYRKKLGLELGLFFARVFPRWILVAVAAIAVGTVASSTIPVIGWIGLLIVAAVFSIAYLVMCWLLFFNDYEKGLATSLIRRALGKA